MFIILFLLAAFLFTVFGLFTFVVFFLAFPKKNQAIYDEDVEDDPFAVDEALINHFQAIIDSGDDIDFTYVDKKGVITERSISPQRIEQLTSGIGVGGMCRNRNKYGSFYLSNISDLKVIAPIEETIAKSAG